MGPQSLIFFLTSHKHNEYCKDLPWPNKDDIDKIKRLENEILYEGRENYVEYYKELIKSAFENNNNNNTLNNFIIIIILVVLFLFGFGFCIIRKCKSNKMKKIN